MASIENVFSKTNLEILRLLFERDFHLRDLAREANCSPAKVLQALKVFEKFDFVSSKKVFGKKIISLKKGNVLLQSIKRMDNVSILLTSKNMKKLFDEGLIGLFGSFAEGNEKEDSDIDLWIFSKTFSNKAKQLKRELEKEVGREVNLIHLTKEKIKSFHSTDIEFFYRLKLTSMPLNCGIGEVFD